MMKYKPWLWPIGIGALAEVMQPLSHFARPRLLDISDIHSGRVSVFDMDEIAARFVTRRHLKAVLAEQLHAYSSERGVSWINPYVMNYVSARSGLVTCISRDKPSLMAAASAVAEQLRRGEILHNVADTYDNLLAFLNGYLLMTVDEKRSAPAFGSFVISLNKSSIPYVGDV